MLVKRMVENPKPMTWKEAGSIFYKLFVYGWAIYGLVKFIGTFF